MQSFLNKLARYRLQLAFVAIVIILCLKFITKDKPISPIDMPIGLIGSIFVILGMWLRSWAAGVINKNKILTTTGPYSLFRHPLYIGSLFLAIGFSILINDLVVWVILLFFVFFVYRQKIKEEETLLQKIFPGQWEQFVKQTGVFFPKSNFFDRIFVKWSFKHWYKHTEYNAIIASLAGLAGIYLWVHYL